MIRAIPGGSRTRTPFSTLTIARAPDGDATRALDLDALYRAERSYLLAQLCRWGVPADDAEDCLHDVLLRAHRLAARYDQRRPMRPWLTGIAKRVALEHKRARRGVPLDDKTEPRVHPDPTRAADVTRALLRLRRVSGELEAERRRVWLAHDLDDVPAPELARTLRVPLNTVYSRLRLARRDVRAALERADAEARHAGRRRELAS